MPIAKELSNESVTIYLGDVLECFSKIADQSIDLVFADPPYNIGKDFGSSDDNLEEEQYLEWMRSWILEISRVTKPKGTVYLMNSTQNFAHMDLMCRQHFHVLSRIVWAYDSSGVQAKTKFGSSWEPILHMSKDPKNYTFNANDILVEAKTGAKRKLIDYRKTPPQPYNTQKVPSNVWEFPRVRFRMDEYENHPTQKPLELMERIIKASTNEGDVVLDPFSGSFSTGDASIRLKRKFVGFELHEEFFKIGVRRLGVPSDYTEDELKKVKQRRTTNKSKKDHAQNLTLDID